MILNKVPFSEIVIEAKRVMEAVFGGFYISDCDILGHQFTSSDTGAF